MRIFSQSLGLSAEYFKNFSTAMPLYSILIWILLLTTTTNSIAQSTMSVRLEEGSTEINLSPNLECTSIARANPAPQGSEDNFDLSHIQQQSTPWDSNNAPYLNHHFTNKVLWCRVELKNENNNHYRWFFVLDNTRLNFVNFYWQAGDNTTIPIQKYLAGDHRQIKKQYSDTDLATALPTFAITLPPGEKGHLYFAIDTDSVTWLTPTLYNSESYGMMVNLRHLWQWLYAAMIMACILLQLALTRSSAGWTEVYYFLSVTSGLFYIYGFFGDANYWLNIESGEIKNNMLYALTLGYQFFGLCFVKRYLRVTEFLPWLGRLFTLQRILVAVCAILIFYGFESNQNRVLVAALCTLMTGAIIFIGLCNAIRHNLNWVWGLAISWLTIALSGVTLALVFMEVIPFNSFTNKLTLWTFPLDVIVLSISFVFQHQRYRKELHDLRLTINQQAQKESSAVNSFSNVSAEPHLVENHRTQEQANAVSLPASASITHDSPRDEPLNKISNTEKRLQGVDCELKINLLMDYFDRERIYCREDISLNYVSEIIGLRPDQTSALLNHKLGTSLSTFTNEYRVREAKRLLQENTNENLINIAINSGFNSRASFNRVFKTHTQMSPAEYRKNI